MTGLGTSQRRDADDGDAPSGSRGQRAGVAAPERGFRLWPPQVTFDAGPLAARARGVGASLTPAALWRNHRLFTIAACVSVIPRVIAALGFKPALLIQDSFSYMKQSVQLLPLSELRPAGYPLVLHLLQPFHSLLLVTTVQHLMGIALGVIIYAVLRRRGLPAWGATLAAVPTLFDSRQIWLESSILPDTLFTLVLMIAVAILVVWPRPAIWQAVIVGLLVSWASVIRGNGAPVFVVILAFLLIMRVGWKVFVACLAAFVVPLAAYALIFFSEHGQLNITNSTGLFLWSRTMLFANCAVIKPPPSLVPLCPENQPGHPAGPAPAWSVPALLGERTPADYLWAAGRLVPRQRPPRRERPQQQAGHAVRRAGHRGAAPGLPRDRGQGGAGDLLHHRPVAGLPGHAVHRGAARQPRGRIHAVLGEPVRARPLQHARGAAVGGTLMFLYQEPVWFPGWVFFLVMAGGLVQLIRRWRGPGRLAALAWGSPSSTWCCRSRRTNSTTGTRSPRSRSPAWPSA